MQSTHPNHAVHPKEEGDHLLVPDAFHLQQLHLRNGMAEEKRIEPEQVNAFNSYEILSSTTLHPLEKDNIV